MVHSEGSMKTDLVVVGGGPAGMMAAIAAAEYGAQVCLLVQRAAGKKIEYHRQGPVQHHQ